MLDTVKIKIKHYKIINQQKVLFYPEFKTRSFDELSENEKKRIPSSQKFFMNRNRKEDEFYIPPTIEIYEVPDLKNRTIKYELKVEFSIPKLIFENNIEEISESHYEVVGNTLIERLAYVGIIVTREEIDNSIISKVHFGKNILVPKEMIMSEILKKISKIDINAGNDITRVRWRDSDALHLYSGSRESVVYDKVKDVKKTKNRKEDKDIVNYELDFLKRYSLENREIFRFEYRLNKFSSVQSEINKIKNNPYNDRIFFKDIFNEDLWKIILNNAWNRIYKGNVNEITLFDLNDFGKEKTIKYENILNHLLVKISNDKNNTYGLNNSLQSFALIILTQELGIRELRSLIKKVFSSKTSKDRLDEKIMKTIELSKDLKKLPFLKIIEDNLKKMEPIREDNLRRISSDYVII